MQEEDIDQRNDEILTQEWQVGGKGIMAGRR